MIESAEIVSIGTELLIGQTLNTNAYYLAQQLTLIGINSYFQSVVGDNAARLEQTIRTAVSRSDLVITSGGLGPTADDITMSLAAKVANKALVFHSESKKRIVEYFASSGRVPSENNWKQVMLPEESDILPNNNGTAPGAVMTFDYQDQTKTIVCLPGPPDELKLMFQESLKPWLDDRVKFKFKHRYLHLIGIGESSAELKIKDIIAKQDNPTIAPYASPGEVCFRLTQRVNKEETEQDLLTPLVEEISERLGKYIYEDGSRSLPQIIHEILGERKETIGFAESCTAGMLSDGFGAIPGVSQVFNGSIVSYNNQIKENVLMVDSQILRKHGAVSEECARAMAKGAAKVLEADLTIAVTGIAGPTGGTTNKPVGTVYIAVYYKNKIKVKRYNFRGDRQKIRTIATLRAFHMAWQHLTNDND